MGMSIDAIIYCFNVEPLASCLNCPYFLEHSGSLAGCRVKRMGEARKIVEKYKKIQEIAKELEGLSADEMSNVELKIKEILDGNDD